MKAEELAELLKELGIEPDEYPKDKGLFVLEQTALVDEFIKKLLALSDKYGRDRNRDVRYVAECLKDFDYSDVEIE